MNSNAVDPRAWIGREEHREDRVDASRVHALAALLDYSPGEVPARFLPPAWHWLCFLPVHRQAESGVDGHAAKGGFLPSIPLPRRMWAGSRIQFHAPTRIGDVISRRSVIEDVTSKSGRSGELVFVKVRHELQQAGQAVITEWQDLVYRGESPSPSTAGAAPSETPVFEWERKLTPDEVLLFRYSAVTFNAHRIHYDHPYATQAEGYPGLVVHGPLQATLLLDLVRRNAPGLELAEFQFRGVHPAFCGRRLGLGGQCEGRSIKLLASNEIGQATMQASAVLAQCE